MDAKDIEKRYKENYQDAITDKEKGIGKAMNNHYLNLIKMEKSFRKD